MTNKEGWITAGILALLIGLMVFFLINDIKRDSVEKTYSGNIIDMGYDPPSSGYKSSRDATYWVVFVDKDVNIPIRVHVTPGTYYSVKKGDYIIFSLDINDLSSSGNPRHHLK